MATPQTVSAKARITGRQTASLEGNFNVVTSQVVKLKGKFWVTGKAFKGATISALARITTGGSASLGGFFLVKAADGNALDLTTRVSVERTILAKAKII